VIEAKTPLYVEDASDTLPSGQPAIREEFIKKGVRALAYLPLLSRGEVIGILYLNMTAPHRLSDNEKRTLELFADQAAIAIENARLYEHISQNLERRIRELEVLAAIGRTVSNLGIDEILEEIHTQAGKLMDVRNIQIAFYNEDRDEVSFPLAYDDGKKVEAGHKDFLPRRRGEYRYGLTEYVIDRGKAEFSEGDVWKWAEKRGIQLSKKIPTKSWIGAPLKVWDRERQTEKVIGLISIQSYEEEDAYDESDLRVLETMVNQAAVAIENARLYETLEQRVEERTRQLREAQEKAAAAERFSLMSEVAAQFAHRMNNIVSQTLALLRC
jgi:GAF domain-containing protein